MKQAEMRLKSAQAELKEMEKQSKSSGQNYTKDKTAYDAIMRDISKMEVIVGCIIMYVVDSTLGISL